VHVDCGRQLKLIRTEIGGAAVGVMKITNVSNSNVTFKIKSTAPKLFTVKPLQGVVEISCIEEVRIALLATKMSDKETAKNKFVI